MVSRGGTWCLSVVTAGMGLRYRSAVGGLILALVLSAGPAQAFELFGFELFGADEPVTEEPVGQVLVSGTLTSDTSDEETEARLRRAATLVSDEPVRVLDAIDLASRARRDRDDLVATLYELGHYAGAVRVTVLGAPLSSFDDPFTAPEVPLGQVVPVSYDVRFGPEFSFGETLYRVEGQGSGSLADYGVIKGAPARAGLILDAEDAIVEKVREQGFARARVVQRDVVARHSRNEVDVILAIDPGSPILIGPARVEGAEKLDPDFLVAQSGLVSGTPYATSTLREAEDRLRSLPLFDRVSVRLADDPPDANGQVPVIIEIAERKRRFIGAGAFWSSTDGASVNAYWGHRNLFGRAERIRLEASISGLGDSEIDDLDYSLTADFVAPGRFGPNTDFGARAFALREEPDHFVREAVGGGFGITRRFGTEVTMSAGLGYDHSRVTDAFGTETYNLILAPIEAVWDTRDDPLRPTSGHRATFAITPAYDVENDQAFVELEGSATAYLALGEEERTVLAGRVATGSVFGADVQDVPAHYRYFLGGGGSVRGFGFRSIGPELANGLVTGGLSFVEVSGEVRVLVTETIGVVPFIDVGAVSSSEAYGDLDDWRVGAGLGLRYFTPLGPLRFDVAVPLDRREGDPDFSIYVGLGEAF
ncbi:MAG: autotransporter assembly complex family protein [Pseudomonadota bacterium]